MDSSHPIAPEDSFDEFQANAVVPEEDEFITLADIVPPDTSVPYLPGDPNEIPYDNEVILTNLDDHLSDANSQSSQYGYDDGFSVDRPHLDLADNNLGLELTIGGHDEDSQGEPETPQVDSTTKTMAPTPGTKRGRKTKSDQPKYNDNDSIDNSSHSTPSVSQRGRKRVPKKAPEFTTPPKTTRRGRPKRFVPPPLEVRNDNEVSCDNDDLSLSTLSKKRGRGGRKKKDPEPVPQEPKKTKAPVKHGRKKKSKEDTQVEAEPQQLADFEDIPVHTITNFNLLNKQNDDSQQNEFENSDDAADDMSLSNLKNSLDKTMDNLNEEIACDSLSDPIKVNGDVSIAEENNLIKSVPEVVEENGDHKPSLMEPSESLLVEDPTKRPKRQRVKQKLIYDEDSDDPFANLEMSDDDKPKRRKGKRYYSDDEYVPGKKAQATPSPSDSDIDLEEEQDRPRKKKIRKTSTNKSPRKTPLKQNTDAATTVNQNSNCINSDIIDVKTVKPKAVADLEDLDDFEACLQSAVITAPEDAKQRVWGTTSEFEDFIANKSSDTLQIKKVTSNKPSTTPAIQIPVLEPAKHVEGWTQTEIPLKTVGCQTVPPLEVPMKDNVPLNKQQSENACQFLKSIVSTTSELGQLMTQKSEDFIMKKINTDNVVDTFKMDYCVRKSFLLLKLAKHNIVQMEEDLSKKYENFLSNNGLSKHREAPKKIEPKKKTEDDDSDCEIVGVSMSKGVKSEAKPKSAPGQKFNPKTVFLNKELSIKMAKKEAKPAVAQVSKEKINVGKGRHSVWISDSVMVKKVKPTQSFLAQDSRNKKPPDSRVTDKMVSDFFKNYYHEKIVSQCAKFVSAEWLQMEKHDIYCYYFVKTDMPSNDCENTANADEATIDNIISDGNHNNEAIILSPQSLISLCTKVVQQSLNMKVNTVKTKTCEINDTMSDVRLDNNSDGIADVMECTSPDDVMHSDDTHPVTEQSLKSLKGKQNHDSQQLITSSEYDKIIEIHISSVPTLKKLCTGKLIELFSFMETSQKLPTKAVISPICEMNDITDTAEQFDHSGDLEDSIDHMIEDPIYKLDDNNMLDNQDNSDQENWMDNISFGVHYDDSNSNFVKPYQINAVNSLLSMCLDLMYNKRKQTHKKTFYKGEDTCVTTVDKIDAPATLKHIVFKTIEHLMIQTAKVDTKWNKPSEMYLEQNLEIFDNESDLEEDESFVLPSEDVNESNILEEIKEKSVFKVKSLADICFNLVSHRPSYVGEERIDKEANGMTINCISTSEEAFHNIQEADKVLDDPQYAKEDDNNFYDDYLDQAFNNDMPEENNCVSQLQNLEICDNENNLEEDESFVLPSEDVNESNILEEIEEKSVFKVKSLADICLNLASHRTSYVGEERIDKEANGMTINCMSMSEEAFHNIQEADEVQNDSQYAEEVDNNFYDDDLDQAFNNDMPEESQPEENNWASQLQLEVSSVIQSHAEDNGIPDSVASIARVKLEPIEEPLENVVDTSIVKAEPVHMNVDQMTVIADSVITKQERIEQAHSDGDPDIILMARQRSFDGNSFEEFVTSNKMMTSLDDPDGVFSQSAFRVRRQFEPDYRHEATEADELDPMSLLVPQTFEPLTIERAKNQLLEYSSDEGNQESTSKKKPDKRGRKQKKVDVPKPKEIPPVKEIEKLQQLPNELAVLTRRMREKIRQEQKKVASSDSEEEIPLSNRRDRTQKDEIDKNKSGKETPKDIQVNDVDSTEQVETQRKTSPTFSGFSAVDQNEIASYQKYVKYIHGQILTKETVEKAKTPDNNKESRVADKIADNSDQAPFDEAYDDERPESPLINYEDPVELLECEPTMPIFDDDQSVTKRTKKNEKKRQEIVDKTKPGKSRKAVESLTYTEKDGWHCYTKPKNDTKLYQTPKLILEKLSDSFVETYFQYLDIAAKEKEDKDINRLINLNTLNRSTLAIGTIQDAKNRKKVKGKATDENASGSLSRPDSPGDHYEELLPSDDEGANIEDELPPPVRETSDNVLAKSSLMNENDSDSDSPINRIKTEVPDGTEVKRRSKSNKHETSSENPENVMLTADKSMNKELNLLHAPVILKQDNEEISPKSLNAKKHKSGHKPSSTRERVKNEDDSSSEEEKQWVTTKEKLLKRMGKKDNVSLDEVKRAKLVTEYIERRGDAPEGRNRKVTMKKRLSARHIKEREKQMRVLSNELYDTSHLGKKFSASYFKGRRNIRKVIDKKSLARSTVVANMEEFERKCRINHRQQRLRGLLGLEEGVNVVVINGEVCLEYDFEQKEPVVAVHPFFTKVMKAHQYEGVKFMWDACFESISQLEAGHAGGGCILAHCMGLGKTLQVLALLHTVLTHPRVGMQRILVCCPLSTVLNWVDEINKWIGPVTNQIKVFELSKLKKTYERAYQLEDWYNGGGIFIIGYELFRSMSTLDPEYDDVRPTIVNKIRTALLDPGPDIVICDEGHLLKNDCSVLAVAMSRVATKRRIVLTGTPMQNNLREYYCMVNFVKPNLLGTYSEYSNRFENPIMNGQHRDSQEDDIKLMKARTHILHKVLEGCLQRQEASVLYPYLPKKHEYTVFCTLTQCQWDLYKHYLQTYGKQGYGKQSGKQCVLRDFHMLQKIWSHPKVLHYFQKKSKEAKDESKEKIKPEKLEDDLAHEDLESEDIKPAAATIEDWWTQYLDEGNMLDALEASSKFLVVFRILNECVAIGDKVLIFSTSLITMDALEYFLKQQNGWSLGHDYFRLDGSVPPEVRQKWVREFNAEQNHKTKLFLISTRAGSLGLNMVAANRVIILDTSWNPAHDIQSIFRVYRFGQKKDCYIYRLVAMGTMEQKIYERSVTKQAIACRVVDEQQIDRHYNLADLTELYRYDELGTNVECGIASGVTDVALLRVARKGSLHAVQEHDSLLRGSSEQELPDHERAAAWMQFQEEHAHKQIQNQLTSSFALHIPREHIPEATEAIRNAYSTLIPQIPQYAGPSLLQPPPLIKAEPDPEFQEKGKKGKKGKSAVKVNIPIQKPVTKKTLEDEENMVEKVMNLLIKHNFHNTQTPRGISDLVASVRKIVAQGEVPQGLTGFNRELTENIAKVLLGKGKEPAMPQLIDDQQPRRGRPPKLRRAGRPRKGFEEPYTSTQPSTSTTQPSTSTTQPSTSTQCVETNDLFNENEEQNTGRRRAAILAEKNLSGIVNLDDDEIWQDNDQDSDYADDYIMPEKDKPQDKSKTDTQVKELDKHIKIEKPSTVTSTDFGMISLLSDDEDSAEPTPANAAKAKKPAEVIPLHPSLLTNSNFINIVAHTYLEGNPMLDKDAANMAAQYSTTKALKEFETTGNPIVNGPIYDIATKVLGIDILAKLHKTNPKVRPAKPPEVVQVKEEPAATPQQQRTAAPVVATPTVSKPRVKARGISDLMVKQEASATLAPKPAAVVPVGLFKSNEQQLPQTTRLRPVAVDQEESILPDDDDDGIVINDSPPGVKLRHSPRKNAQSLILNSVIASSESKKTTYFTLKPGQKLIIPKMEGAQPSRVIKKENPKPTSAEQTICLDSDDEEPKAPKPAPKKRMVATKSTAKPQTTSQPVPVSLTSAHINQGQPVPVSLTAANPEMHPIPDNMHYYQPQMTYDMQNKKMFMVPANQMNQLQRGVTRIAVPASFNQQMNMVATPSGNFVYSTPQQPGIRYFTPGNMDFNQQGMVMGDTHMLNNMDMTQMNMAPNMMTINPLQQNMQVPHLVTPQQQTVKLTQAAQQMTPKQAQSGAPPNKTVCKPGDILRITPSGEVEILNKVQDPPPAVKETRSAMQKNQNTPLAKIAPAKPATKSQVAKIQTKPQVPPQKKAQETPQKKAQETPQKKAQETPQKKAQETPQKKAQETPQKKAQETPEKNSLKAQERIRTISSSSSSSSGSSRASSPEKQHSIFKDIVHIKSVEDILDSKNSTPEKVSSTSNTKNKPANKPSTYNNTKPTTDKNPLGNNKDLTVKMTRGNSKPSSTQSSNLQNQIKKTDSVLKKLDHLLGPSKQSTRPVPGRHSPKTSRSVVDVVDLDDDEPLISTTKSKPAAYSKPSTSTGATKSKQSTSTGATKSKPSTSTGATKLVGTSKNIIIKGDGKATLNSSANKNVRVTSVTEIKKRPATSTETNAPKKKKSEPMTLKDFDIDDIDDIIELE